MEKKIWKYKLNVETINSVSMPKGSQILSVGLQNNEPVIWALVNPYEENKETKVILMFGTGESIFNYSFLSDIKFLGTIQLIENGVAFAFHLFEIIG